MQITFLGTSCMQPTKERNHPGVLISYKNENILIDCGENIQRQMKIAGLKPAKITRLLISHWHGDHTLGIMGLMQTMHASEYVKKLLIYGPEGTKDKINALVKVFVGNEFIDYEVNEVKEGVFFENEDFALEAMPLEHGIKTLGFNFIEKERRKINVAYVQKLGIPEGPLLGKLQNNKPIKWKDKTITPEEATYAVKGRKITYISDTSYCKNCIRLAENADLVISEASFASKLKDKAEQYKHLTAKEAGLIANQANAKKLVLTHISQRYKTSEEVEEDARSVFDNVICAEDFMKIKL